MKFDLQSASNCNDESGSSTSNYNADLGVERQFNVFFVVNLVSFVIYFTFALYVAAKSSCKMDLKAWANMGVNSVSLGIKAIAWTYMISIYDKA